MKIKWIGARKHRVLELPIPFEAKSAKEGEIHFNPDAEVEDELARKILKLFPGSFEAVGARVESPRVSADAEHDQETVAESEPATPPQEEPIVARRPPGRPRKFQAIPV